MAILAKSICAAALAGVLSAGAASAATITAMFDGEDVFEIFFDDIDGNGKLELSEFTGWDYFGGDVASSDYPVLGGIGNVSITENVATPEGDCVFFCFETENGAGGLIFSSGEGWTLSTDATPSAVPLPASAVLLIGGLAGLVGLGRRRNRAA